jgi:hypothetical protein
MVRAFTASAWGVEAQPARPAAAITRRMAPVHSCAERERDETIRSAMISPLVRWVVVRCGPAP